MGHKVISHYGFKNLPEADIVILHIDKTVVPDGYVKALQKYPVVLNRHGLDVSKNSISSNILQKSDDYLGPVIIKTDANFGGIPELNYKQLPAKKSVKIGDLKNWAEIAILDPDNYPILKHKNNIPDAVWNNPNLVVEKFLPESGNGLFFLRYYIFLGDAGWASRFGSKDPIVKFGSMITEDKTIPVPEDMVRLREQLGFDYGRFDYVEHHGKNILLDINKTVGGVHKVDEYADKINLLARGISRYL